MNPETGMFAEMKGDPLIRRMSSRTLSSRSRNGKKSMPEASAPVSACSFPWSSSLVKVSIPQSVVDDQELPGAKEPRRDDQRAYGVVGGAALGVADHVSVAHLKPQELRRVKAGIHAEEDRHLPQLLLIVAIMVSTPLWARMSPASQASQVNQRSGYSLTIRHGLGWFSCGIALYLGEGVRG
jgi:hypothetical protein